MTTLRMTCAALVAVGLIGSVGSVARAEVRLQGAGATFPNPIYQKWVTEYQKSHPDVKIDYQSIGSGGGIKAITEKTVDFAGSDAPMTRKERNAAPGKLIHIPTVAGAVVAAYNLPGVDRELKLTGEVLAQIYQGKISKWNEAPITALNANVKLPDLAITPVWRTDGSGTTFVFTNYLITQSDDFASSIGAGKQVKWPVGQGGKGNEGVTAVVHQTAGALGYVELNYAAENDIAFALLQNREGQFVRASADSVAAAGEGALAAMNDDLAVNIWDQPGEAAYPVAAFTYVIVYQDLSYLRDQSKARALLDYLKWSVGPDAGKLAADMGYAPLSDGVRTKVNEAIGSLTWSGEPLASR
jgi:phosphate transport system substrate-binding protein